MDPNIKTNILTRDDFDGGPVSLDLIDDKLYLGNVTAACDLHTLTTLNITYILTIDSIPLPRHITDNKHLITKYIQVTDMPKEDILTMFEITNKFISEALDNDKTILVHCYYGMSRSASVVIAYFMKKHDMNYEEAYQRVKSRRNLVCPNPGFVTQLKLYGSMGAKLDFTNSKFKNYRLKIAADKVRKVRILPQNCMDLIQTDPGLTRARPDPLVYRCRKCRRIVACQSHIINHYQKATSSSSSSNQNGALVSNSSDEELTNSSSGDIPSHVQDINSAISNLKLSDITETSLNNSTKSYCTQTYFIEPIAWMKDITHKTEGKLYCPHCKNKLGSFSWLMGCQCPCGVRISPAFYLVPSKVEWSNVVQNVESVI